MIANIPVDTMVHQNAGGRQRAASCSYEMMWAQKNAPRGEARSLSYMETKNAFGLLSYSFSRL